MVIVGKSSYKRSSSNLVECSKLIIWRRRVQFPWRALDYYDSLSYNSLIQASMVESVDTSALKAAGRKPMGVQVSLLV